MAHYYLDFEGPIKEIDQKILELETDAGSTDHTAELNSLKSERKLVQKDISSGLSRWQRVQLARHPQRPFSLDYIKYISSDFIELHGDRYFGDDSAVIAGIGNLNGQKVVLIGQQKGRNTKDNLFRNFGMMRPEGYRKSLRIMKLAQKFDLPIITLIDTPGAYPGLEAEERGQGEAIAKNLLEMFKLKTQIICIVIGEGASGGALGIGIGDSVMMLENTWYSVISPESCSSILWRSWDFKENAAEALKLTPHDMKKNNLIDKIISEPLGGAHRDREKTFLNVKNAILNSYDILKTKDLDILVEERMNKFTSMGVYNS